MIGNGTRVLVTGSAGVIGQELTARLLARHANILSIDRLALPASLAHAVRHLVRDLAEPTTLAPARDFAPEVVFHLAAAFERACETAGFWPENWNDNLVAHHHVAELCSRPETQCCVFASSYLIYSPSLYTFPEPRPEATRLRETDPIGPRNLCGAAKYYGEHELRFAAELVHPRLRVVDARIFRVYGRGSRDVVSRWIRAALGGEEIVVYNRDNRFDYVYAGDVAEGLLRLADTPAAAGVINLATGQSRRVAAILEAIATHVPELHERIRDEGATEAFEASAADVARLQALTGWTPPTRLEQGVAEIVRHERGQPRP